MLPIYTEFDGKLFLWFIFYKFYPYRKELCWSRNHSRRKRKAQPIYIKICALHFQKSPTTSCLNSLRFSYRPSHLINLGLSRHLKLLNLPTQLQNLKAAKLVRKISFKPPLTLRNHQKLQPLSNTKSKTQRQKPVVTSNSYIKSDRGDLEEFGRWKTKKVGQFTPWKKCRKQSIR